MLTLANGLSEKKAADTGTDPTEIQHNDSETELLDKEYGVRYASACEGELSMLSISSNRHRKQQNMSNTHLILFTTNSVQIPLNRAPGSI